MTFGAGAGWSRSLGAGVSVRVHDNARLRDGCSTPRDILGRDGHSQMSVWVACRPLMDKMAAQASGQESTSSSAAALIPLALRTSGCMAQGTPTPGTHPMRRSITSLIRSHSMRSARRSSVEGRTVFWAPSLSSSVRPEITQNSQV